MEREAAKPKEPKKSAERVLLAERLKETGVELDTSVAARRAKFGDKAAAAKASTEKAEKPKAPEKPKVPEKKEAEKPTPTTTTDGTSTSKPKCEDNDVSGQDQNRSIADCFIVHKRGEV